MANKLREGPETPLDRIGLRIDSRSVLWSGVRWRRRGDNKESFLKQLERAGGLKLKLLVGGGDLDGVTTFAPHHRKATMSFHSTHIHT